MTAPDATGGHRANDDPRQDPQPEVTAPILPQPDDARTFANLRARAALGRYGLYQLADGTYLLTGYGALMRELPDLRAVAALLRQMGIA